MKFCYQCGRFTGGKAPLFCTSCGRSYDIRLCPRLHPNPRYAKVCSQCGAHELSEPQPSVPFRWKVLEFLVKVLLGTLLVCLSLAFLVSLLQSPQMQNGLLGLGILLGILLGVLWWLWSQLPEWFQKFVRRVLKRKENNRERH
jgi:hypothetical protein